MSVDRLHVICGNCGHDATDGNFTWRHRPKEIYGNGEFNLADVFISCKNCDTLHSLGKYMQEESDVCNDCCRVGDSEDFQEYTLFHQITTSPEVLAEKLVVPTEIHSCGGKVSRYWAWRIIITKGWWESRAEALAAAVAKLKEVVK